eukprot:3052843-Rhodomonas_salina.2
MPLPTDNDGCNDFADASERSDGEGNEVVQALGGAQGPDRARDYPDLLDPGVPVLDEVPVPEIQVGQEIPAAQAQWKGEREGLWTWMLSGQRKLPVRCCCCCCSPTASSL